MESRPLDGMTDPEGPPRRHLRAIVTITVINAHERARCSPRPRMTLDDIGEPRRPGETTAFSSRRNLYLLNRGVGIAVAGQPPGSAKPGPWDTGGCRGRRQHLHGYRLHQL